MKILIANWKSNPDNPKSAVKLAKAIDKKGVVVAPPFPFLSAVRKTIKKSALGAQDLFWADGPYTGEVSARDLKILKVKYVIVGHSERRRYLSETDELINKKVKAALKAGLKVVLCVGEPAIIRKRGIKKAKEFVKKQLVADLKKIPLNSKFYILNSRLIVAYEPVWAISTAKGSKPDTPQDAVEMIEFIKGILYSKFHILNPKVLYGGSVTAKNARGFLKNPPAGGVIDGALVGSASLHPLEFHSVISSII